MKKLFVTLLFAGFISFIPSSLHPFITPTLSAQIPSDGLVAWYPFNGNANDESGNGNHGVVNGATLTADRLGNANSSYNFNGGGNYIDVPFSSSIGSIQQQFTSSVWINMNGGGCNPRVYEIHETLNCGGFNLAFNGTSNSARTFHSVGFGSCSNGSIGLSGGNNSVPGSSWHHVAVVVDGINGFGNLYVDGSLVHSVQGSQIPAVNYYGASLCIGNIASYRCDWWGGKIDDLGFWNRALSPSEIQQLYTTTSTAVGCNLGQIASVPTSICSGESITLNATPGQSTQSNCFAPAVKSIGNAPQGSHKVVTDAQGNYYTTGTFTGGITVGNTTLTSSGNRDAFLVKYNNCGVVQWAIKGGSTGEQDYPYSMAVDASGNVYWVGRYNQTFTINGTTGSFTAPYTSTSNGNHQDGFLVKLDSNGGIVWGASCRGTSNDGFNGIALDNSGNPIVTGGFNGCCPSSFAVTIYGPNGNVGISSFGSNYGSGLIVKFDANGNILWKGSIYNRDTGLGSIAVDNNDNIYLTTSFRSWSNGTSAQFIDANNASYSIFNPGIGLGCLIKLNANGVYQWGQSFGNVGDGVGSLTSGTDVAIDANGNPWICGFYKGNAAVFYSTNNQNLELPAAATYRGFLAQYSAAGVPLQVVGHERSTGDTYFYGLARGNGKWGVVGTFSGQTNGGLDAMLVEFNDNLTVANAENTGSIADDSWNSIVYNGTDFVLWGGMGGAATIANESVASASAVLWNRGGGSVVSNNNYTWSTGESNTSATVSPTQTTTYTCTFSDGTNSCSDQVTVTVLPNVTNTISASIIEGESYILGAQTLTTAGTYTEVFTSANGCDSTVTVTLSVEPLLTCEITAPTTTLCEGESLVLNLQSSSNQNYLSGQQIPDLTLIGNYGDSYYYVDNIQRYWAEANLYAMSYGGSLAIIETEAEDTYILQHLPNGYFAIGLYQDLNSSGYSEPDGGWFWIDGSPLTYSNWGANPQEPNNSLGIEHFAGIHGPNFESYRKWNDHDDLLGFGLFEFSNYSNSLVNWASGQTSRQLTIAPTQTTTYSCTVTTATQTCTDSITITVNPLLTWYADADADGFGEPNTTVEACDQPVGFVADNTDCNDADATVFPNAEEICFDGMDNNCDGVVDENCAIFGCTNPEACNFNANANAEDGSCILPQTYLNCNGTCVNDSDGDGVCDELEVLGCTDSTAFNFNPQATNDDGTCEEVLTCEITAPITTLCEGESVTLSVNTIGGAGTSSQLPANLQQGLVAYYPFNGSANDESGNGNNGVVYGATLTTDRFGNTNSSYNFNVNNWTWGANGDEIYIPFNPSFNSSEFSVSVWVKRASDGATLSPQSLSIIRRYEYGYNYPNGETWVLELAHGSSPNGSLAWGSVIQQSPSPAISFSSNTAEPIPLNEWSYLTMTYSMSTIRMYLNGILSSSVQNNNVIINTVGNSGISIGISDQANGHWAPFSGIIDDIALYNRALPPSEIQQLYTAQSYAWSTNETTPTITVTPTQNTTYTCTVTQGNQTCTASLDITVNPNVTSAISATIIQGETYTLGTQTLTTAGTYTEVFTSASGCDSTVTLTLSVEPLLTCEITATNNTLCEEESTQLSVSFNSSIFDPLQLSLEFNATYIGAYNGKHYFISNEAFSWLGARQHALSFQNYNLDLAVFETLDENDAVDQLSSSYNEFLWIGLYQNYNSPSYSEPSGGWSWVNGSDIDYWNFEIQEPSNGNALSVNTQEDYGHLKRYPNGKWNDYSGGSLTKAIFELSDLSLSSVSISWSTLEMSPNILVTPTVNTTYTATVTTATQTCTDSITITVNPLLTWYADADADGFGNPDDVVQDCNQPLGYIADNTDCNDEDAATYPGAAEICDNNRDENCDGVDSLCFVAILGCTDVNACNFNPEANTEDNSCILPQPETCNGLDDNCNGQVDEGLSAAAINAVSAVTALYPVCSGNSIRSANLNVGANSAVIEGNGNDLWFSINAQFNTLRAGLSAATGDNDVRLYTIGSTGCLELIETEHEITTGNQVLLSDQLTVGQTYYVAVHNISGAMNPSAKICFNHLLGSTCDHYYSNNTGIYPSVCASFKAQYRANAVAYTFDVLSATQNNVNQNITPWSYTTTSASTVVARLGTLLPANQGTAPVVYTLKVPVLYSLFDAAGNFENLFAQATTTCTVTLNAEATIALRSSDRCPTNKSLTSTIAPDRTVCGAMRYDWEFTEVLPNPGTAQVVQGGAFASVFFLSNVPGITAGKTYSVRVRPVHSSGIAGQWGAVQCLRVGSAGMVNHPGNQQSENESESVLSNESRVTSISIYPNPTATGSFVLNYNGARRGELTFAPDAITGLTSAQELVMMDITGKVVFKTNVVLNGNIAEIHFGDLESGLYLVDFGGEKKRVQVVK